MENSTRKIVSHKIVFRADGNYKTGLGHVYRCLALGEMLREQFSLSFAICSPDFATIQQINAVCNELLQLPDSNIHTFANDLTGNEIVVLDGYHFNTDDQRIIKSKGCLLVCIDDLHNQHFVADVVINHSITANSSQYSIEPTTTVCTGADFILLRRKFLDAAKEQVKKIAFRNAFVCFGGADTNNFSYSFSCYLAGLDNIDNIHVLIGSAFTGSVQAIRDIKPDKVRVYQNIDAVEIVRVMRKCDFAVVSASSVAYECASTGLPILAGYYLDSQIEFYNALLLQSNVWGLGDVHNLKFDQLSELIIQLPSLYHLGYSFIDGSQDERYLKLFHDLARK